MGYTGKERRTKKLNRKKHDDEMWNEKYSLANQFFEENGHLEVPYGCEIEGVRLRRWLDDNRTGFNHPHKVVIALTKERKEKLDKIGMRWEQLRTQHGMSPVPYEVQLKEWEKWNSLKKEDEAEIGKGQQYEWDTNYNLAKKFHIENGHLNIPYEYKENNVNLGKWIARCRYAYNTSDKEWGKFLTHERRRKLDEIGMVWQGQVGARKGSVHKKRKNISNVWLARYAEVMNFLKSNKQIPVASVENEKRLVWWYQSQRGRLKQGKLIGEEKKQMVKLEKEWKKLTNQSTWDENYEKLLVFIENNKRFPSHSNKEEKQMYNWYYQQLARVNQGELSKQKIDKVNNLQGCYPKETVSSFV